MDDPVIDKGWVDFIFQFDNMRPAGTLGFGRTDYVFCKGITDAWCITPGMVPASERGMFDLDWAVRFRQVTDGLSHTIAMGEGAGGARFPISKFSPDAISRWQPYGVDKEGELRVAYQGWAVGEPMEDYALMYDSDVVGAAVGACTLEPLNKSPVTAALYVTPQKTNCIKTIAAAPGIPEGPIGGPHMTPNFRSDHPGGGNFLMADGSVHFVVEEIDMLLYQQLSTMAGAEVANVPD
jgi:prepilin-type processing-associated H-X9-DG protein